MKERTLGGWGWILITMFASSSLWYWRWKPGVHIAKQTVYHQAMCRALDSCLLKVYFTYCRCFYYKSSLLLVKTSEYNSTDFCPICLLPNGREHHPYQLLLASGRCLLCTSDCIYQFPSLHVNVTLSYSAFCDTYAHLLFTIRSYWKGIAMKGCLRD